MSKMNDMAMTIEALHSAAAAINEAANWLATQFGGTTDEPPAAFRLGDITENYENPVRQAEYLYSLIESEVDYDV